MAEQIIIWLLLIIFALIALLFFAFSKYTKEVCSREKYEFKIRQIEQVIKEEEGRVEEIRATSSFSYKGRYMRIKSMLEMNLY